MKVSDELKQEAVSLGLCQEWQDQWGKPNKKELIEKFVRGIDFAIKNNFPSVEYINANFTKKELRDGGVFCDDTILTKASTMVVMGNTKGEVSFGDFDVVTLYVRHNANIHISISRYASVTLYVFDNAKVYIDNKGFYRSRVYKYSDNARVISYGNVMLKKRNFEDIYSD